MADLESQCVGFSICAAAVSATADASKVPVPYFDAALAVNMCVTVVVLLGTLVLILASPGVGTVSVD